MDVERRGKRRVAAVYLSLAHLTVLVADIVARSVKKPIGLLIKRSAWRLGRPLDEQDFVVHKST